MSLIEETKNLCKLYKIIPARSKGQNFLIKEEIYDKIVSAADLKADDIVLEVGPGLGFLTSKLAKIVKKVIAVELDDKLAEVLQIGLDSQGVENVEVVNLDILKFSIFNFQFSNNFQFQNSKFKIVANLPYNISSVFLRKFLSVEAKPSSMVLMLQKEVAERICASPSEIPIEGRGAEHISRGKPGKMSLLAVSVQFYAEPEIIDYVPAACFWPEPAVDSAIIKIRPHPAPLLTKEREKGRGDEKEFFRLVKIGFSARRKMLKNNLAAGFRIEQKIIAEKIKIAGISENCRPQELSVDDWLKLFDSLR